jgi:UDP-N-acetylmuramyl pentapeptide synthase
LIGEVSGLRSVLSFPFSFVIVVWIVCACVCVELGLDEEELARRYERFRMISHRSSLSPSSRVEPAVECDQPSLLP